MLKLFRQTLTVVIAMTGLTLTVAPARAAFCGEPFDITPVVKLTIATYPKASHSNRAIDTSYIKIVSVNGTYAYSLVDTGSRRIPFYWEKPTGTWTFKAANRAPADWDSQIVSFLVGGSGCNNPNWKKHT